MKVYDDMGREFDSEYDINHDGHIDREEEYAAGVTFASDYEDQDDILRTCRDYDIDPDDVPGYRERHSQSSDGYYDGYDSDYDDDYSDGYSDGYDDDYSDGSLEYDIYGNPRRSSSDRYGSSNRSRYNASGDSLSYLERKGNTATREELASMIESYIVGTSPQDNPDWYKIHALNIFFKRRFKDDYRGYLYDLIYDGYEFQLVKKQNSTQIKCERYLKKLDLIYDQMLPLIPYDKFDEVQTEVARVRSIYLSAYELTNQCIKKREDRERKQKIKDNILLVIELLFIIGFIFLLFFAIFC